MVIVSRIPVGKLTVMLGLLLTFLLFPQTALNNILADDLWYVGEGTKKDMFVTYRVQEKDTNNGRPFEITLYFKEFNSTGNYWEAPTFVVDQGSVINGTFNLSNLDLTALGSSIIPKEMNQYRSAYTSSLQWLSSFVPKPGQSLSASNWGKIASIGGSSIEPSGKATIGVPAGTFETNVIKWHKGIDNFIWIKDGFPYPLKAQTYADVTTGDPPVQFAFELLASGEGQPTQPESKLEIPVPPLEERTERGTYFIRLLWEPTTIHPGNTTKFGIVFMDDRKNTLTQVGYDFAAIDPSGELVSAKDNQLTRNGTAIQNVIFENQGLAKIKVIIKTVESRASAFFVETGQFGVTVQ